MGPWLFPFFLGLIIGRSTKKLAKLPGSDVGPSVPSGTMRGGPLFPSSSGPDPLGSIVSQGAGAGDLWAAYQGSVGPGTSPAPAAPAASDDARAAAAELATYYRGGGRKVATIRGLQARMGGIRQDGLMGDETRERMRELGTVL